MAPWCTILLLNHKHDIFEKMFEYIIIVKYIHIYRICDVKDGFHDRHLYRHGIKFFAWQIDIMQASEIRGIRIYISHATVHLEIIYVNSLLYPNSLFLIYYVLLRFSPSFSLMLERERIYTNIYISMYIYIYIYATLINFVIRLYTKRATRSRDIWEVSSRIILCSNIVRFWGNICIFSANHSTLW